MIYLTRDMVTFRKNFGRHIYLVKLYELFKRDCNNNWTIAILMKGYYSEYKGEQIMIFETKDICGKIDIRIRIIVA